MAEIKLTPMQRELTKSIKKTQFVIILSNGAYLSFRDGNPFGQYYNKVLLFDEWGDAEIFAQGMELKDYHVESIS